MSGIAGVIDELAKAREEAVNLRRRHKQEQDEIDGRIVMLEHWRDLMSKSSISADQIQIARSVLRIRGRVSESAEGAFDAAVAAVAAGGKSLRKEYIGAKRYGSFHQRCDCEYGYGPSHGSIVFAVELLPDVRQRAGVPLTIRERDAAVAFLLAEKALV